MKKVLYVLALLALTSVLGGCNAPNTAAVTAGTGTSIVAGNATQNAQTANWKNTELTGKNLILGKVGISNR